ncbi:GNAT family N-acetyltransferase [Pseudaestuariivita sp.]|uniref:GNAT family N-acetyltransferase n=1 Tax=Pseudaestuariivita sp. TaxID=2211669 RepID=UPI0040591459
MGGSTHPRLLLETGRIVLRRFGPFDLGPFLDYRTDPEVARYQSWEVMDRDTAKAFLAAAAEGPLFQDGTWSQIAIGAPDGALLGDLGIYIDRAHGAAELGITLARQHWGQGLGTEAYRAGLTLLWQDPRITHISGIADARNTASLGMLERAGLVFTHAEEAVYDGETCTDCHHSIRRFDGAGGTG